MAQDRMVTLSNTAGLDETKCSNYLPALSCLAIISQMPKKTAKDTSCWFSTHVSRRTRDDRTCLDRERDNIQNVERLHREILHRFKYSVDR